MQDIEESLFRTFLEYLYGKPLGFTDMTIEELIELLAVADRYEVYTRIQYTQFYTLSNTLYNVYCSVFRTTFINL